MLQKWAELEVFHKFTLSIGIIAAVVLTYWFAVIGTINKKSDDLEARIESWHSIYVWMQDAVPRIKAYQDSDSAKGVSDKKIHTLVSETVNRYRLKNAVKKIDKTGTNAVKVSFDDAPFDTVIQWISYLKNTYKVSTVSATIKKSKTRGMVNGALTLEAPQ
ncbi:MAG: hypothetical protein D6B28_09990 [Gammaproteobacteria bacterium]|nr:MAG: hypothetical protein D6B28_09990 [Gammaproteobacteria bacterium]